MTEVKKEVKVFVINKLCDQCKAGHMIVVHTLGTWPFDRQTYLHRCENCTIEAFYTCTYPRIEYGDK